MDTPHCRTLGETWIDLVRRTLQTGERLGNEGFELRNVQVEFRPVNGSDTLLARFADRQMLAEMHKVFFAEGPNTLGHSYAERMRGPAGRRDLTDIIELLRAEPSSKRAVLTLCGAGDGKVPCINVVQFLVRAGRLETVYFARGQDAFKKFYADGVCVAQMAARVAAGLQLPAGTVTGFIASSHLYDADLPAIRERLAEVERFTANLQQGL